MCDCTGCVQVDQLKALIEQSSDLAQQVREGLGEAGRGSTQQGSAGSCALGVAQQVREGSGEKRWDVRKREGKSTRKVGHRSGVRACARATGQGTRDERGRGGHTKGWGLVGHPSLRQGQPGTGIGRGR